MAEISTKVTVPMTVTASEEDLTINKKGSVIVNLKGEYDAEDAANYAVQSTTGTESASSTFSNTITLDGAISTTDKMTDNKELTNSHDTYGLKVYNEKKGSVESVSTYTATIVSDKASTIKATRDTTSKYTVNVYGIGGNIDSNASSIYTQTYLLFDGGEKGTGKFQDAVTVTATNSNKTEAGALNASGIAAANAITFNDEMAAAIKVTATDKSNAASAIGITGSAVFFNDDITKSITATATGAAIGSDTGSETTTTANGINASGALEMTGLAGAITAKATANSTLNSTGYGVAGNAAAYGINGATVTINGDITKAITSTATANSVKQADKNTVSGDATATGINASGIVSITGKLAGAVKATATSKANAATAYGINATKSVTITEGITKDISATATGAATASAETTTTANGINADGAVTIGEAGEGKGADLAGAITAKATGNATLSTDKKTGYMSNATATAINGDSVTINGDITKAITSTATANSVKKADKTVVGGYAMAYGIQTSGAVKIDGALAGAIKVTATSKANYARAYGIQTSSTVGTFSVNSINATITATVNGADGGLSFAYGIRSSGGLTVNGDITKAITAKVNATPTGGSSADAYGIYGEKVDVKGDITGTVTATATANSVKQASGFAASGTASAFGIAGSSAGGTSISGTLAGAVKATATGKGNKATAYGLYASNKTNVTVSEGITGAITATATGTAKVGTDTEGKGSATTTNAYGIYTTTGTDGSIVITGVADKKGNITAIGGAITATATGSAMLGQSQDDEDGTVYMGSANAYGITATAGAVTITGDITKAITAKATTKAFAAKELGDANGGDAIAYALNAKNDVMIDGSITGAIKSTATANSVNLAGDTISGTATAYGINTTEALTITGTVKGTVSATATSKGFTATAYGITAGTLVTSGNLTAVTAKADGYSDSSTDAITATGIKASTMTLGEGVTSIGKITATATDKGVNGATAIGIDGSIKAATASITTPVAGIINATATGTTNSMAIGIKGSISLTDGSDSAACMSLNITATSKLTDAKAAEASSTAIALDLSEATADTNVFLTDSKLTAKSAKVTGDKATTAAYAIKGGDKKEFFNLSSSTLTGDVDMGAGDDTLLLVGKSKITGDVDMGAGKDAITIYSGSQIKGDLSCVETWGMVIADAKSKNTAMWEGGEIAEIGSYSLDIYSTALSSLKSGKEMVFNLMKDTDNEKVAWTEETKINLTLIEGVESSSTSLFYNGEAVEEGGYSFALKGVEKGNATTMQLAVTKK